MENDADEFDDCDSDGDNEYENALDFKTLRGNSIKVERVTRIFDDNEFLWSGPVKTSTGENDLKFAIIDGPNGLEWKAPGDKYECKIVMVKKEKKLMGMKTYDMYQITPNFSNIQVGRKLSHFQWLHDRLFTKFSTIAIPPLPDRHAVEKNATTGEDLQDCSIRLLQSWINRITSHPVLSQVDDLKRIFLSCTDHKAFLQERKMAEKDRFVGGNLISLIRTPSLGGFKSEAKLEGFAKMASSLDTACSKFEIAAEYSMKCKKTIVAKECQRMSHAFTSLARSFEQDSGRGSLQ